MDIPQAFPARSRLAVFAATMVALLAWPASSRSQVPMDVVDQISVLTYRHYLDDLLYAHDGDVRTPYAPKHDLARDNIQMTFLSFGLDTYLDPFEWRGDTFYNVVAVKEGLVTPEQHYIISGHYDSVNVPGADDDASAVAGVMEIARVLSRYSFESTLIFIGFDLEEPSPSLNGSRHYAEEHQDDDIRGMVSMDLIAYNTHKNTCVIYGREASNPIKFALRDAVKTYSNGVTAEVRGPLNRSDHAPFEAKGKQACWLIETDGLELNPCYHKLCDSVDTPGYIDYDYAVQLVRGLTGYLVEQAGLIDVSRCNDMRKFKAKCSRFGTVHAKVKYKNKNHNGQFVTFGIGNRLEFRATVYGKKARLFVCCFDGEQTVSLLDPPDCKDPKVVDCN